MNRYVKKNTLDYIRLTKLCLASNEPELAIKALTSAEGLLTTKKSNLGHPGSPYKSKRRKRKAKKRMGRPPGVRNEKTGGVGA